MEQKKNCVDDENDGDVLKQENQDLAGLLSSPDTKPRHEMNGNGGVKQELNPDLKEEIKEEIKQEHGGPGSVGKLPNGDAVSGTFSFFLTLYQTTNFRPFQTERVCRQQFQF